MDGVLPRASTGRPRVAAVGAILTLCLVWAPLMSLFPVGVWDTAHALTMSGAGQGILLLTPVVAGVILLMFWLSTQWLEHCGVNHPAASAALVTATAMVTPVVVTFLAPDVMSLPGGTNANIAFLTAAISTLGMGASLAANRPGCRWKPGLLPAMAVISLLLAALPSVSEQVRARAADERSRTQILSFEQTIAVLDHPDWEPSQVHEVNNGLRLTYRDADGRPLYVVTWDEARSADPGIHAGCDFPGMWCRDVDGMVLVHHSDGHPSELRTHLSDGTVASLIPEPGTAADLVAASRALRAERPGEREALVLSVTA
ncbi:MULTISPECIES: hypothetical protein [unclassified Nocardiopsis]|uniref:hypothetical protein n=1 Tax=unclassified Nocardiopsis TaxID=2649073 RepID=UPI001F4140C2|nr:MULTISPECIES: hypothetical protein [unclassified Nocardiopsis]